MFRAGVISLVIAGWLLSQLAALPHVHADGKEHTAQPHFHFGHHHGAGHSHSHPPRVDAKRGSPRITPPDPDHDADASFIAARDSILSSSGERIAPSEFMTPAIDVVLAGDHDLEIAASTFYTAAERPPGPLRFLMLRTLRI